MRANRAWLGVLSVLATLAVEAGEPAGFRRDAERFAREMERRHGFAQGEVASLMAQAEYRQEVIDAIRRPYEAKPWHRYRPLFLTARRIRDGADFQRRNGALLERAQARYGVPPHIISAVIGIETNYGRALGRYEALDALSTLGLAYPKRADFFRRELEQLLLLGRDEGIDVPRVTGSYAGALGIPQFIPSSYRAYAVDFDGDGRRDLSTSVADAIGSVGSYLERHGWEAGEPVAFAALQGWQPPTDVTVTGSRPEKPAIRLGELGSLEIPAGGDLPASTPVTLIRLDAPRPEYWLGLGNFYAITRYNRSNLYAMAVYQLGQEIRAAVEREAAGPATAGRSEHMGE